ncbi:MAG: TerC family protein [Polyangiaceae bacterium]|nr:TerC family protein [Polyangiaceae bacterium]MBK8995176.1 TerC family protein [Myxococcales bacterium]MCL4750580.1 TerC family protein [Myxococcales bacterium]
MLGTATWLDWAAFAAAIVATMLLDRLLVGKGSNAVSFREASVRSVVAIVAALAFAGYVHWSMTLDKAVTYIVAYLVEKSLSVDNLFVFLVIFSYFGIRERQQQRILFWGIVGAVVMRAIFILAGSALLHRFHWMMYVFGGFLVITGIKLALKKEGESVDPESNLALRFARKYMRTTDQFDGDKFFIIKDGLRHATPLFLVLLVIEFTDVLFAVDSVPAVLAVSDDVYVVYTSNIFAILGLRSLYFMLAGMMSRFHYLDLGLAVILVFIGAKMLLSQVVKVPNLASLGVIAGVLTLSIVVSLLKPPKAEPAPAEPPPGGGA